MCAGVDYRLCCTATPAPNDIAEIANHAEFLGVMRRVEMLASFFIHDDTGWRLKRHAETAFYRWMASWAACRCAGRAIWAIATMVISSRRSPFRRCGWHLTTSPKGSFYEARRYSGPHCRAQAHFTQRVEAAAELVNGDAQPYIVWRGLNDESNAPAAAIPDAVVVEGSMSPTKNRAARGIQDGKHRVLITKPKIAGFG